MLKNKDRTKKELLQELEKMSLRVSELENKHKMADELILQSILNWEDTFNNITDMITIHDKDFNIIFANRAAEKFLQLPLLDISKNKCYKYYHGKESPPTGCPSCACLKTREPVSFEIFEPHLKRFIEIRAMPQFDSRKELIGLIHIVRDISDRKRMEDALQKAHDRMEEHVNERTAELLRTNKELLSEIAERKKVEKALQGSESSFKKLSQEFNVLLDAIPDCLVLLSPELEIMWSNKSAELELGSDQSGPNGQYCYKLCANFSDNNKNCPTIKSFTSGREETSQIATPDGRFLDVRAFPLKDDAGKVKSVMEVARNITAKVKMEKDAKMFQAKMIHANKMTSLGTLVSGVAHEINNPNTYIKSNTQLLSRIWNNAKPILDRYRGEHADLSIGGFSYAELIDHVPKLLGDLNEGSVRIQNIVDNLRDFARPEKAEIDNEISINDVVLASISILKNQITSYTDNFRFLSGDDLPFAKGNAQQIEQVIINLIMNSLHSLRSKDAGVTVFTSHNKKKGVLIIKVKDEGSGMNKATLDRVTEPFFTTKLESGGTGLGLSISYAIVKEHDGSLEFESEPGKGTTATLKLPSSTSRDD
ncbi:MAG: PAS domain-containing protein [Nitrospiraceae bacterium]|nr:MAG: PAS domain-containing protein [Nitrospiraceae bacterium]